MIELTVRIQASSLEEALSELNVKSIKLACEKETQSKETQLTAAKTEQAAVETQETKQLSEQKTQDEPVSKEENEVRNEVRNEIKPEEVRAMLVKVREAGLDLAKILEPYGGRFPDVKKEDYPSLLKDAQDALAKKENN